MDQLLIQYTEYTTRCNQKQRYPTSLQEIDRYTALSGILYANHFAFRVLTLPAGPANATATHCLLLQ